MSESFEIEPTVAGRLRKGDRLSHPDKGFWTLTDRPLRLRGRGFDQQWVTLRMVNDDGKTWEIEVHEGDWIDKVVT